MSKPITKIQMTGFRGAVGAFELDFDPTALPGFAWDFLLLNGAGESDRVSGSGKCIRVSLAVKGAVMWSSVWKLRSAHLNVHFVAHFVPPLFRIRLVDPLEPAFGVYARVVNLSRPA